MMEKLNFGKIASFLAIGILIWEVLSGFFGIESLINKYQPNFYISTLVTMEVLAGAAFVLGITGLFWKKSRTWALGAICLSLTELLYIGLAIYLFWAINRQMVDPKIFYPGN